MTKAILVLEDGRTFNGASFGADGETFGEIVFNTSMTGYQEILTDPSYAGQIVCMTFPLIGNYGVNETDVESRRPWVEGFVVREASRIASNWRSTESLDDYLKAVSDMSCPRGVQARAAESIDLSAVPFRPQSAEAARRRVGGLSFVEAYELNSSDARFGGLSGVEVLEDGNLLAISDAGYFVWIDLDRRLSVALLTNRTLHGRARVEGIRALRPLFHDVLVEAVESDIEK